jgi:hypothetical protein
MIEITSETIDRVEKLLAGVPKGAERALAAAMNRGLSKISTGAARNVREVYAVQSSALSDATKINSKKASSGNLAGYVAFSGVKIPLYKFKVTPLYHNTGKLVKGGLMKGGGATFEDAFIATMKSGHTGVFERTISSRLPIEEKMGLSAAQMIANTTVMSKLEEDAQKTINDRLEHEIDRLLSGYGG